MAAHPLVLQSSNPAPATNAVVAMDIRAEKPPVPIPTGWLWALWLGGAVLLALAAWWAWRRWRRRSDVLAAPPPTPPHERARQRLAAALAKLGDPDAFCVAVSGALREYLEERFDLRAPERTTEEFLPELQASSALDLAQKDLLGDFLGRCDRVKFARYDPTEMELRDLHTAAVRLVDETEPPPFAPDGAVLEETTAPNASN